jgi:hypothetical protein
MSATGWTECARLLVREQTVLTTALAISLVTDSFCLTGDKSTLSENTCPRS